MWRRPSNDDAGSPGARGAAAAAGRGRQRAGRGAGRPASAHGGGARQLQRAASGAVQRRATPAPPAGLRLDQTADAAPRAKPGTAGSPGGGGGAAVAAGALAAARPPVDQLRRLKVRSSPDEREAAAAAAAAAMSWGSAGQRIATGRSSGRTTPPGRLAAGAGASEGAGAAAAAAAPAVTPRGAERAAALQRLQARRGNVRVGTLPSGGGAADPDAAAAPPPRPTAARRTSPTAVAPAACRQRSMAPSSGAAGGGVIKRQRARWQRSPAAAAAALAPRPQRGSPPGLPAVVGIAAGVRPRHGSGDGAAAAPAPSAAPAPARPPAPAAAAVQEAMLPRSPVAAAIVGLIASSRRRPAATPVEGAGAPANSGGEHTPPASPAAARLPAPGTPGEGPLSRHRPLLPRPQAAAAALQAEPSAAPQGPPPGTPLGRPFGGAHLQTPSRVPVVPAGGGRRPAAAADEAPVTPRAGAGAAGSRLARTAPDEAAGGEAPGSPEAVPITTPARVHLLSARRVAAGAGARGAAAGEGGGGLGAGFGSAPTIGFAMGCC
jgi:hypothetical protein